MEKYKFRMYIPFGYDEELLGKAVESIIPQIEEFSSWASSPQIVIHNNSGKPITKLTHPEKVEIIEFPFELVHAQQANYFIRDAHVTGQPFMMLTHTDSELLPGAMENMIKNYERIKDTKWGMLFGSHGGHIFSITNPLFYVNEDCWYDPNVEPFYYMDNFCYRLMTLRGYVNHTCDSTSQLVKHYSSQYIKCNPRYWHRNNLTFGPYGEIYKNIWGGLPGQETSNDLTAGGLYPLPDRPCYWNSHWHGGK